MFRLVSINLKLPR